MPVRACSSQPTARRASTCHALVRAATALSALTLRLHAPPRRSNRPAPRIERIAESSGTSVEEVGRFVMEFNMMRGAAVRFANGACPAPWRDPRSRGALCEASRADVAAAVGLRAALTRCAYSVRRRERRVDPLSPSLSLTNPRREPRVDPREHGCGAGQRGGGAHEPQAAAAREQEEEEEASEDRRLWEVSRSACEPWDGVKWSGG